MKTVKVLIFILFLGVSSVVIYEHFQQADNNILIDFINQDEYMIDMANIISIENRIRIKDTAELISQLTGVKVLVITLNDSYGLKNADYSRMILAKWADINNTDDQYSVVISIYKKNPEINLLFTDDLDYVLTKDISVKAVAYIKKAIARADDFTKISIKEGKKNDDRYKGIIGEGIVNALEVIRKELESASLTISRAEYVLRKDKVDDKDDRLVKKIFDNTLSISLIVSLVVLILGYIVYYSYRNRCPQCGNRLRKEKNIINYPKNNIPGIREINYCCLVCGFCHKERQVFYERKSFFKK